MNLLAPAPSRASTPPDPPPPASRLAELSPRAFRRLLLGIAALSAAMAAEGVQTFAEMRERHYAILARQQAVSPVSYGTALPGLHALASGGTGVRVLVRADSAGARAAALCALAAQTAGDPNVRWVALSADVHPCVAQRIGGRMLRAAGTAAVEMAAARWIAVDAEGRALYGRPGSPSPAQVQRTAGLLAPMKRAEAAR
ncbi:MAG TPA: hypothetical protein VFY65_18635 [Longimicrobium sp.]|nr:hypothetical protein [Longimicrobium sp.]